MIPKHTVAFGGFLVSHDESEDILEDEIALTILHMNKKQIEKEKKRISACKKDTSAVGGDKGASSQLLISHLVNTDIRHPGVFCLILKASSKHL